MNLKQRANRNRDIFLFKTNFDGTENHTLFEVALKFGVSVNQIWRIERQFAKNLIEASKNTPFPEIAQNYNIGVDIVERLLADKDYVEKIENWVPYKNE